MLIPSDNSHVGTNAGGGLARKKLPLTWVLGPNECGNLCKPRVILFYWEPWQKGAFIINRLGGGSHCIGIGTLKTCPPPLKLSQVNG